MGPERLCLWDSKQRGGRPDVMKLVKEAYAYWKAEGLVLHQDLLSSTNAICCSCFYHFQLPRKF